MSLGVIASSSLYASAPADAYGVSTPRYWYDASDAATLTLSGSDVTAWADKSGNGEHLTPVAAGRPQNTGSIGGRTALYFNGSNAGLAIGGADLNAVDQFVDATDGSWTALAVFVRVAGTAANVALAMTPVGADGGWVGTASTSNYAGANASGGSAIQANGFTLGTPLVLAGRQLPAGGNIQVHKNGAFGSAAAASGVRTGVTRLAVGTYARVAWQSWFYGSIGEVVGFDRALTDLELSTITSALMTKWSIT